eukprot:1724253-Prorocentrum_lima.AAC.1
MFIIMNITVTPRDVGDTSLEDPREDTASSTGNGPRTYYGHGYANGPNICSSHFRTTEHEL